MTTTTTIETAHVDWASVERIGADRPAPHLLVLRARTGDPDTLTDEVTLQPGDYLELLKSGDRWRYRWDVARIHRAVPRPDVSTARWGLLEWTLIHHDIVAGIHRAIPVADIDLLADVYGGHWLPELLASWTAEFDATLRSGYGLADRARLRAFIPGKVGLLHELVQRLRWCQSVTGLPQ